VQGVVVGLLLTVSGCALPDRILPDGSDGDGGPVGGDAPDGVTAEGAGPTDGGGHEGPSDSPVGSEGPGILDGSDGPGRPDGVDGPPTPDAVRLDAMGGCRVLTLTVALQTDEGEIDASMFYTEGETDSLIHIGYYMSNVTWGFFRFALPAAIANGEHVMSAQLDILGAIPDNWDASRQALLVNAEASDDAPRAVGTDDRPDSNRPSARVLTQATVRWPASGGLVWNPGEYNSTPDLSPVIQELVNRPAGLAMGAHIQLWLGGEATNASGEVTTPLLAGSPGMPPQLSLTVCAGF
jgi:hypothetical protein